MNAATEQPSAWSWSGPLLLASAGFELMTAVAVAQFLRASVSFEALFKELGVVIPWFTLVVLNPWTHVTAGLILTAMVGLRHHRGLKEWVTATWVVTLLAYIAISHAGLFEPLIRLIDRLGAKAG